MPNLATTSAQNDYSLVVTEPTQKVKLPNKVNPQATVTFTSLNTESMQELGFVKKR